MSRLAWPTVSDLHPGENGDKSAIPLFPGVGGAVVNDYRPRSTLLLCRLQFRFRIIAMQKFDERTAANLDVVLDTACRGLPNSGGDHETRKFIATKLMQAALRGKRTLGSLEGVARQALRKLRQRAA